MRICTPTMARGEYDPTDLSVVVFPDATLTVGRRANGN